MQCNCTHSEKLNSEELPVCPAILVSLDFCVNVFCAFDRLKKEKKKKEKGHIFRRSCVQALFV